MGFVSRSLLVLFALYGLVFAVGDAYLMHGHAPLWWGLVFVAGVIGVQYVAAPWMIQWFFSIHWEQDEVPAAQRAFVEQLCREKGLPPLRMGIIWSDTPNAFAYGRLRRDARIVMTEGLLKILTEDEINAVLAHEVGHVAHYDFAVMALASMGPLLLYQIYIWADRVNNLRVVSYAAYVAYWIGQFLVLLLNRTREFGADHFSAEVTREPSALSSALVKIGYGMVRERSEAQRLVKEGADSHAKKDGKRALQFGQSLGLMGISAAMGGEAMALVGASPAAAAKAMRWDLVNPWARFYELRSTHPLTALRLKALNKEAAALGQRGEYPLPEDAHTHWTGFVPEFLMWAAPLVCGFLLLSDLWIGRELGRYGVTLPGQFVPWVLIALGITWAGKILYRYRGDFRRTQVGELLEDVTVSQMRPRAVEVEGEVIGHGIPGAVWSADLVLKDETGMMFLYYRSSIPFGRFFFAIRSAERLIGDRVTVRGWYRRGPTPYVEIGRIEGMTAKVPKGGGSTTLFGGESVESPAEYEKIVERSYSQWIQLAVTALCVVAGVMLLSSR